VHDGQQNFKYQKLSENSTNIYGNRLTDFPKLNKKEHKNGQQTDAKLNEKKNTKKLKATWTYIRTEQNLADIGTRAVGPETLKDSKLW
jgi:hypothetical protein